MSFSISDDLEKTISDIIHVEAGVASVSMVALGVLISAINSFNQTNIGLAQSGMIKLCQYIPLAPTFRLFVLIVVADVVSLSAGLFARIIDKEPAKWRSRLINASVCFLVLSLVFFAIAVLGLANAFYYYSC
ncbi:MAG: hypothetical protein ABSG74_06805 [Candidatus Bathyarchaeia archaeon]|jgi:hypothetical protein